jgi:hypothetical protein
MINPVGKAPGSAPDRAKTFDSEREMESRLSTTEESNEGRAAF